MGYSKWSDDAYSHLSKSRVGKSADEIFSAKASDLMRPFGVKMRESRDSDAHPDSLSLAVFLDVTGSMGRIPEIMVKEKLGTLMNTLITHGILHPQILFGAIGDHVSDSYPLQIGQFESGTDDLDKWLTEIFIEGGGGGQIMESYLLGWLFCARHTSIDCFEKRGQKGFLFTIGDEASWDNLDAKRLKDLMGYPEVSTVSDRQLLEEAQRSYHVFHIHINEASYKDDPSVLGYWRKTIGERLIVLNDYNAIAETIASTVAMIHGVDLSNILSSFDAKTAKTVSNALSKLNTNAPAKTDSGGLLSKIFKF
jgi:hypothetical protein